MTENKNGPEEIKRSDMVRSRKSQRVEQPISNRADSTRRSVSVPNMAQKRGTYMRSPNKRSTKAGRVRQRRSISMTHTQGGELRLPGFNRPELSWRILSGFIFVALIAAIYALVTLPVFVVNGVVQVGFSRLNAGDMARNLEFIGLPMFSLDKANIERKIRMNYWELTDVSIHLKFPGTLEIIAAERQPVIRWVDSQTGNESWVDVTGVAFPVTAETDTPLVEVIAVEAPPDPFVEIPDMEELSAAEEAEYQILKRHQLVSPERVQAALFLSEYVPEGADLVYDNTHGFGWLDPEKNWQVYFGLESDNVKAKMEVYNTIVEELIAKDISPELISVEHLYAPYYRLKR